ncbi:hypothetical protein ACG04Q_19300 [Roseateles sp. DXS20W]|uniref:DUF222 domain-containing protein n=1 Tax=Pelomonas lactea TaxID=3299030 RepID=A0ABW7GP34_9BURK
MVASNLNFQVRSTPAYLRGLVDNRARADGQVRRLTELLADLQTELAKAHRHRDACDAMLQAHNADLARESIAPIHGTLGAYGQHGGLQAGIRECLTVAGTVGVTVTEIAAYLEEVHQLKFVSAKARSRWATNLVNPRLREFLARGEAERIGDALGRSSQGKRWRWKASEPQTVDALATRAAAHGVKVSYVEDDLPGG